MQQWNVEHRVFAVEQFFLEIMIPLLLLQLFEKTWVLFAPPCTS
jgi:hypothetical protein